MNIIWSEKIKLIQILLGLKNHPNTNIKKIHPTTNTNIIRLKKSPEYEYEYYSVWKYRPNMNTNILVFKYCSNNIRIPNYSLTSAQNASPGTRLWGASLNCHFPSLSQTIEADGDHGPLWGKRKKSWNRGNVKWRKITIFLHFAATIEVVVIWSRQARKDISFFVAYFIFSCTLVSGLDQR